MGEAKSTRTESTVLENLKISPHAVSSAYWHVHVMYVNLMTGLTIYPDDRLTIYPDDRLTIYMITITSELLLFSLALKSSVGN